MEDSLPTSPGVHALAAPRVASRRARGLCLLALLGLTAWLAHVGGLHILARAPDFEYFYKCGAWLLERGSLDVGVDIVEGRVIPRGTLDWYWPCVTRIMTLFAVLPYEAAGFVWLGLNLVAMLATIRLIGRHLSGLPPQDWPVTQLVPVLLLLAYWTWEFQLNQVNNFTLLLVVGSFAGWQQGHRLAAGFWLGLAVLLKLTPALLVLWFLLKRQTRTVVAAVLTIVLAGPVADMAALGPTQAADAYRVWLERTFAGGSPRGLILTQTETDWRNQGLGAVLTRWLHPANYNTHFDNDPRIQADHAHLEPRTLNIVTLPLPTVANLVTAILVATLGGAIWLARKPAARLPLWQLRFEWALFLLLMLWMMPVMRRYHMIWALPAVSLLAAGVHYRGFAGRWVKLTWLCIGLLLAAQLSMLSIRLEASGPILASVAALALPVVVQLRRLERAPTALPEPFFAPVPPVRRVAARPAAADNTAQPLTTHA